MVEPIMFVGIGFLLAGLLVIGVIPLVHARAVRLTQRRLEALTPLSMAEIQADKDQLRAEFAMSTRRLEMSVEQMKAKTSNQLAEIGKKSEAIGRLKLELSEKTAALMAAEAKERLLTDELETIRGETAGSRSALEETKRSLATTDSDLTQLKANYHEALLKIDGQRVELAASAAQAEVMKGQIESYEKEVKELHKTRDKENKEAHGRYDRDTKDLQNRLSRQTTESESLTRQLAEEHSKSETLANRVAELDRLLIAQTTETEILGRRVQELVARLDEQGRFLADREFLSDRLRNEAASAQKTEADIRHELTESEGRHRFAAEALKAERALVEEQLKQTQEERAKLQREIAAMKREAETAWASERMENAVLRERINDVAAEVAKLTATLEGPSSAIDKILAADPARPAGPNGNGMPSIAPNGGASKGTLADRIRALQGRASRMPQPSGA
jgi:chromosome segregation ATPase